MLHEVLLALSGHPSPLFQHGAQAGSSHDDFPLLAPSEKALLDSIAQLSALHRKLKQQLQTISSTHESISCRAVATSVRQTHLVRFQKKIVDAEDKILRKDATIVGAYDIVPLASVAGRFEDWNRLMPWYREIADFMLPEKGSGNHIATSATVIDKLRRSAQTGYPEIESAALELAAIAERAWLRQLSSWLVYGKIPTHGYKDFFIRNDSLSGDGERKFVKNRELLPAYVSSTTASSILFIGRSLNQAEVHRGSSTSGDQDTLAAVHLQHLSSLSLPLVPTQFSRAVDAIRLSLSQNVLQHLLPISATTQLLTCLREFFLLGRGDFGASLIAEAEARVETRQQNMGNLLAQDPFKALQGLSVKDAELNQVLRQVWKSLVAKDEHGDDSTLDYAQAQISLSNPKGSSSRPSTSDSADMAPELSSVTFNNLLFPNPTELTLNIASPMDLFITTREMETYTAINSYLLAIERGHARLSDLWKRTPARREHPDADPNSRSQVNKRNVGMRRVWATFSAALFMLSETAHFFEGEIVRGACEHFKAWVEAPLTESVASEAPQVHRDPETLASGHRAFLNALVYSLLLTDTAYTKELRSLLGDIDNMIAFFGRSLGVHTPAEEEGRCALELDRARKKVDSDLKSLVRRLRQIDQDRVSTIASCPSAEEFVPWKGGSVDRLLMKLEFGRLLDYEIARS